MEREGGREREREGGRVREREGERKRGREGWREGGGREYYSEEKNTSLKRLGLPKKVQERHIQSTAVQMYSGVVVMDMS